MKKSLLFSAAILAAGSAFAFQTVKPALKSSDTFSVGPKAPAVSLTSGIATRGAGAIDFSYSEGLYGALTLTGIPSGTRVYMMFEMTPEDINEYAGNQVTGFTVVNPAGANGGPNRITGGRFFYTTTFESEDYTQDFSFTTTAYDTIEVTLDTPYTITGEEETLAFGYSLLTPSSTSYYIPMDGVPNDNPGSCLVNTSNGAFPTSEWMTIASDYGALSMWIRVEGDNLPENKATISAVDTPLYLPISGDGNDVQFLLRNAAINDISSVEVTVSMTDTPDLVQTIDFPPLAYGKTGLLAVKGVKAAKKGFGEFGMRLTKVNGQDVDGRPFTANVPAYDNGYETKIVAEDATGTWCGWCPGGIEALEYLKSICPERAIAIGAHNDDVMAISSYQDYINAYVSGFPNVMYNRTIDQTPTSSYANVCSYIDEIVEYLNVPSYANVELSGVTNEGKTAADVTAKTTFALDTDIPHYLSFVVVEDGVGPYPQANYFGTQRVPMNGWESKGSNVSTVFNDVARYYNKFPGIANSLPSQIEEGNVNEYSISLPITNVKKDNYRVIALITNGENGRIVNACQIDMSKETTGVDAIEGIEEAPVEYFNLNGVKVANPTEGIFIRRQGSKTEKVVVK